MKISNWMMGNNAIRDMEDNLERLNNLREQASSGKAFQNASDNPRTAREALGLRSSLQANQAYLDNAQTVSDWMSGTESALDQMIDQATRALNLGLAGTSDTNGVDQRTALATEINDILHRAIDLGNSRQKDDYIFSGYKTNVAPFEFVQGDPNNGIADVVQYNGDQNVLVRSIGKNEVVTEGIVGDKAFTPLYKALIATRDALENPNFNTAALTTATDQLRDAISNMSNIRTDNGARQRQVQSAMQYMTQNDTVLKGLLSQKEDANLVEVISQVSMQQTTYQAVVEVSQRTLSTVSLFDLLR